MSVQLWVAVDSRSDLKGDHMDVTAIKTGDSVSIELNDITKAILEKYKEVSFSGDRALPSFTNQAMKPYIDIVDSIKTQSMTKFNNLL